jgi:hypothetical protein
LWLRIEGMTATLAEQSIPLDIVRMMMGFGKWG